MAYDPRDISISKERSLSISLRVYFAVQHSTSLLLCADVCCLCTRVIYEYSTVLSSCARIKSKSEKNENENGREERGQARSSEDYVYE